MRRSLALALAFLALGACSETNAPVSQAAPPAGSPATPPATPPATKYPGTDAGARQLLTDIRSGDAAAMTKALRPTAADYRAVFADDFAAQAEQGYDKLWSDPSVAIGADPANTELELSSATTEDIAQWTKEVEAAFPGGYHKVAAHYKPGLRVYRWKYTKPGETTGMAYDGLVFVNGHWAWFPKPWRMLK